MKVYLAGERLGASAMGDGERVLWQKHVENRLYSYFYHGHTGNTFRSKIGTDGLTNDVRESFEQKHSLFCDSGAFSAFTKGAVISIPEYATYIKRCEQYAHDNGRSKFWDVASSLDFIGKGEEAAQKSYDNFCELRSRDVDVCPVFHVREPDHWLAKYVDEGYSFIAVGGMVPEVTRWLMVRLDGLWSKILTNKDGTPKTKIHGFGLTDQKLMFRYPWYSVDSSSWLMTGIFGSCVFRDGDNLRKVVFSESSPEARKYKGWHYSRLPSVSKAKVDEWLEPYGVSAQQLSEHYSYRDVVNAAVYQNLGDLGAETFFMRQETLF